MSQVRDLMAVVEREKAAMGLFISLDPPTRPMSAEANGGGFFRSDLWQRDYPKIQLRTIGEMLSGSGFDLPLAPRRLPAGPESPPPPGPPGVFGRGGLRSELPRFVIGVRQCTFTITYIAAYRKGMKA